MINNLNSYLVPDKYYLQAITLFFFLLGSQLLVNHWFIFIFFALFLIDWRKIFSAEVYTLTLFLLSLLYPYYNFYIHKGIYGHEHSIVSVLSEILMIFVVYLLGVSLKGISTKDLTSERKVFYLLYGFFIAYGLVLIYSFFVFPINQRFPTDGMRLYYTATESIKHIHYQWGGTLVSTVVAYSITVFITVIPFIIFNFKAFKDRRFTHIEIFALISLALSSLFFALKMGRRMTLLFLLLLFIFFSVKFILKDLNKFNLYRVLFIFSAFILVFMVGYFFIVDANDFTFLIRRMMSGNFQIRIGYWAEGWQYILQHPWGGAGYLLVDSHHYYAHNAWIDIGKRFGIFPFILMILFWIMHIRYFAKIILNQKVSNFMKSLILVIAFALFADWMIEPLPLTHKSLFFYTIFFMGFLKYYADLSSEDIQKADPNAKSTTQNINSLEMKKT